jgi:hypothetical protein
MERPNSSQLEPGLPLQPRMIAWLAITAMTMVMAVPAMTMMVVVSNFDYHLCTRLGNQRYKEQKGEQTKRKFLHNCSDATHTA